MTARAWSTEGVVTLASRPPSQQGEEGGGGISCHAYHLTAFSVLLDPIAAPLPSHHASLLSILSYVGLSLSSAALILTIITYAIFR